MNLNEMVNKLKVLPEEELKSIGLSMGWLNKAQLFAGLTAHDVLRCLPRTMAANAMAMAPHELSIEAGVEDCPVDLSALDGF
jgi:hypothetical protein